MSEGSLIVGSVWRVPENFYQPIRQNALLLNKGKNHKAAQELFDVLEGRQCAGCDAWLRVCYTLIKMRFILLFPTRFRPLCLLRYSASSVRVIMSGTVLPLCRSDTKARNQPSGRK